MDAVSPYFKMSMAQLENRCFSYDCVMTSSNTKSNQSCIIRVVQVIKSLQDPLEAGIIYRVSMIMSGKEAHTHTRLTAIFPGLPR